ncbi:HAD family hydrolase [Parablautia muri]|uniref:HAD family hydrolase n=1 Tax=Parablautia muri TaxID=2320879 RepID=A0A9X5BD27_9FIRM|nr:HAD-IA family hydrolase [Parablautia muri]NBJ91536.1 HAD family hydrolase [Parablautia muri]
MRERETRIRNKRYEAVIFDLDGTLLNTLEDLRDSVNYGLSQYGMPQRSLEEIRHFVGNGVQRLIERAVPEGITTDLQEKIFEAFKEHYKIHCNDKTRLYAGIPELLAELKRREFSMAIVSNKLQEGVDALWEQYFKEYLPTAIGARDGIRKKPAPDTVIEALKILGIPRKQTVYVGDSEVDIATARNSEMDCITVTWGFRTREEQKQAGAVTFVDKPSDIIPLLYL